MAEEKIEVKTYTLTYNCDKCGHVVEFTGVTYLSNPAQHEHECPECKEKYILTTQYPAIKYEKMSVFEQMRRMF